MKTPNEGLYSTESVTTNASCTQAYGPDSTRAQNRTSSHLRLMNNPCTIQSLWWWWDHGRHFFRLHLRILQLFQSRKLQKGDSDRLSRASPNLSFLQSPIDSIPNDQSMKKDPPPKTAIRTSAYSQLLTHCWQVCDPDNDHLRRIVRRSTHGIEEGLGLLQINTPSKFIQKEELVKTNHLVGTQVNTVKESDILLQDAKLIKLRLSFTNATLKMLSLTQALKWILWIKTCGSNWSPYDVLQRELPCAMQETILLLLMVDVTT